MTAQYHSDNKLQLALQLQRRDFALEATLELPGHGVTGLIGPSGCGKSSLLRSLAGLEPQAKGSILCKGNTWQDGQTFLPAHQRGAAMLFQGAELFPHLNVAGNLQFAWERAPHPMAPATKQNLIQDLGLSHLLEAPTSALSGGEKQRVALGRCLLNGPDLLLLDEPLSGLDDAARHDLLQVLERTIHSLNIPVIYASHATDEIARLADQLVILDAGKCLAYGDVATLLSDLALPPAQSPEAEALIFATIAEHDQAYQLTWLDTPAGRMAVPRMDAAKGSRQRLRIKARDVSLTRDRQDHTSILNILPAEVRSLQPWGAAQMTVQLVAGGQFLLARVTRRSAESLELAPGKACYAQVKSVALSG